MPDQYEVIVEVRVLVPAWTRNEAEQRALDIVAAQVVADEAMTFTIARPKVSA